MGASALMPRLDLDALRRAFAPDGPGLVRAAHRASLLAHPRAAALPDCAPPLSLQLQVNFEALPGRLDKGLSRAGVVESRVREAIIAEASHLARLFSALADDPTPWLEISTGSPGPLAGGTRLALVCALAPPGKEPRLAGSWISERLPEGMAAPGPIPDMEPGTALVLRLEPGPGRRTGTGGAAPPGFVLWLSSSRTPDGALAEPEWVRPSRPGSADVLLASTPFGPPDQPSLGLSLLKGTLPPGTVDIRYFALTFARRIGNPLYIWIAEFHPNMLALLGEWLFSHALSPQSPGDTRRYLDEILLEQTCHWLTHPGSEPWFIPLVPDDLVEELLLARSLVDGFLDGCVEEILARRPRIVGLTSTFQQHVASLALARRLKERAPEIAVLLGGANCEGVMGVTTARNFPFLDAVVCGEGEVVFPQLVERLLAGQPIHDLPGVYSSSLPAVHARTAVQPPSPSDLDALPFPDFEDFFGEYEAMGLAALYPANLLFETSRGCWWGEKQHCTFCGLNGLGMAFRSKSPERALAELKDMTGRHPGLQVITADNILDTRYFKTFLPRLAEEDLGLQLFYEVKSNLKKEEIRALRAAGVTRIQPGIESLSDEVLRIMRKGVGALQNVRLLKWCEELQVAPLWNLIWGFPGEPPEEYARMGELLPLLHHLPPPTGMSPIYLERFSPNHSRSGALGFADVRPAPSYGYIYPLESAEIEDLAYFFSYAYQDGRSVSSYARPLRKDVLRWREVYEESRLVMIDRGDHLLICDSREVAVEPLTVVDGLARELYLACDDITSVGRLCGRASRDLVEETLAPLVERRLLLRQGDSLLALAVPGSLGGPAN